MKGYQLVLFTIVLALAGVFCLRPPEIPSWDIELKLPLYVGRLNLVDILDSACFRLNPDSTIEFVQAVPFEAVHPDNAFELVGVDEQRRIAIADFPFRNLATIRTGFSVKEMLGSIVPDSGGKVRLGPFSAEHDRIGMLDGVETAEFLGGAITVSVSNHTGILFDSVIVATQAGKVRFEVVRPGELHTTRLLIGATRVASPMSLRLAVGSPGTGPDSVLLKGLDSVVVSVYFDSVHLGSGRVRLPAAAASRRCPLQLISARSMRIDRLEIEQGRCELLVRNCLGTPLHIRFAIPQAGTSADYRVEARSSTYADIDLRGVVLDNGGQINAPVWLCVTASISGDSDWVDIYKDDGVEFDYSATGLLPRTAAGCFREPVYLASQVRRIRIAPAGIRGLRMSRVTMVVDLENQVGFPIELLANIQGIRAGTVVGTAKHSFTLRPSLPGEAPGTQQWVIPLQGLVNTGADSIGWECNARILGEGYFQLGSCLTGAVLVSSPLRMAMVPDTVTLPSRMVEFTERGLERLREHLVSGTVTLAVTNHLPVPISGRLILLPVEGDVLGSETGVDSIVLPFAAPTGRLGRDRSCVAATDTILEIAVDSTQMAVFRSSSLAARVVFELPSSDTVVLSAGDGVRVQAVAELRVRVGESR